MELIYTFLLGVDPTVVKKVPTKLITNCQKNIGIGAKSRQD